MLHYEATFKRFPPSRVTSPIRQSWTPIALLFCEQTALAQKYRLDQNWDSPSNEAIIRTPWPLFVCPSAPQRRFDPSTRAASGDYGSLNEVKTDFYMGTGIPAPPIREGVLAKRLGCRAAQITDGLSNTFMVGEDAGRPDWYVFGQLQSDLTPDGNGWADPDCGFSISGTTADGYMNGGTCVVNCSNDSELYSFHPAGTHALSADGSVHFVSQSIDAQVLAAQVTRQGGEALSANTSP